MKGIPIGLAARAFRSNLERLTGQERRVLQRMLMAKSCKQTAHELNIAVSTTKNLRSRVLEKLMAENAKTLLRIAALARRLYLAEQEAEARNEQKRA